MQNDYKQNFVNVTILIPVLYVDCAIVFVNLYFRILTAFIPFWYALFIINCFFFSFQIKLDDYESQLKASEETQTVYLDQIEELTHKLTQAENKITSYEATKVEEGAKVSENYLLLKRNKINN